VAETKQRDVEEINRDTSGGKTGGDKEEEEARLRMGGFRHNHTAEPVDAPSDEPGQRGPGQKGT
jgi:hypothetical protein